MNTNYVHVHLLERIMLHAFLKFVTRLTAAVVNTFSGIVSFYRGM